MSRVTHNGPAWLPMHCLGVRCSSVKGSMFRSRFLSGLVRQSRTKSYRTLCATDVEKVKKLNFHSVYVTDWCTPPGNPLSSVGLNVSKVSLRAYIYVKRNGDLKIQQRCELYGSANDPKTANDPGP